MMASTPIPRRLPAVPQSNWRHSARPLPTVPQSLLCKRCNARITSSAMVLPLAAYPPDSRTSFRGFSGKASLFTEISNVHYAKPAIQLMATGAHTMAEITCAACSQYLGWKIVRAHEKTECWKEGYFLLELELLQQSPENGHALLPRPGTQYRSADSDSDASR